MGGEGGVGVLHAVSGDGAEGTCRSGRGAGLPERGLLAGVVVGSTRLLPACHATGEAIGKAPPPPPVACLPETWEAT